MPIDPEMDAILDVIGRDHAAQLSARPLPETVAMLRSGPRPPPADLAARVEDRQLALGDAQVPVRICWPEGQGPHPICMNFHGGGWVTGSVAGDELRCQRLTIAAHCITISVDYRLAPEHPFPAPFEDCLRATRWARDHAAEIGGDADRIAVSGASAGAHIAAAVALSGEAAGFPKFQLLFYPVIDPAARGEGPSGGPWFLTRAAMDWYWRQYLGDFSDHTDPRIAPHLSPAVASAPPALIIGAELDPLAEEARLYSETLSKAGVMARYVEMPGVVHGFVSYAPYLRQTREAMEQGAAALRQAFSTGG